MTSPLDTITCRVGNIEGPFTRAPSGEFKDGETILVKVPAFWVVRVLKGTILEDRKFHSHEAAQTFWASVPAFDSTEAEAREKAYFEERARLNRG